MAGILWRDLLKLGFSFPGRDIGGITAKHYCDGVRTESFPFPTGTVLMAWLGSTFSPPPHTQELDRQFQQNSPRRRKFKASAAHDFTPIPAA